MDWNSAPTRPGTTQGEQHCLHVNSGRHWEADTGRVYIHMSASFTAALGAFLTKTATAQGLVIVAGTLASHEWMGEWMKVNIYTHNAHFTRQTNSLTEFQETQQYTGRIQWTTWNRRQLMNERGQKIVDRSCTEKWGWRMGELGRGAERPWL